MFKLQNLLTTLLQKENQYDDTLKEAISMVNTKWELGRESKVEFEFFPLWISIDGLPTRNIS